MLLKPASDKIFPRSMSPKGLHPLNILQDTLPSARSLPRLVAMFISDPKAFPQRDSFPEPLSKMSTRIEQKGTP